MKIFIIIALWGALVAGLAYGYVANIANMVQHFGNESTARLVCHITGIAFPPFGVLLGWLGI